MKNFKIILLVILFILLANISKTQTFIPEWNNNSNIPWLGSWHLASNDVHIKGNFSYGDGENKNYYNVLNINKTNGWAMISRYTQNYGYFSNFWNNGGNNYINNWYINSDDKYITLFQSSTSLHNLLAINSRTGHAQIMSFNGNSWSQVWGNQGSGWISGWLMSDDDVYLSGNFDYSTTTQELVCINTRSGWLAIFKISGNIINCIYSNSGVGNFSGWIMRTNDIFLSGNLDGGNETELIAINQGTKCSSIFKMINNNLTSIWYNNCNPAVGLGGWTNFYGTKFIIHDFDRNPDGKEEIMFVNPGNSWCTIKKFDPTNQYWPDFYCNYGSGWIDGWHISSNDEYIGGNYSYADYRANLLFINNGTGLASLCYTSNTPPAQVLDNVSLKNDEGISISPNPFNMQTKLLVSLKKDENVKIIIYDILGKEIKLVNNSVLPKGIHSFEWNGTDNNNNILSSGNYFVKVISESSVVTKRLVINK